MIRIDLNGFLDSAMCKSILHTSNEGFVRVTYTFIGGKVYGIVSDFGDGSWGLVTCLGGRCSSPLEDCEDPSFYGEVYLNGQQIPRNELSKYSCFISEKVYDGINTEDNLLSAKACIEKALENSKLPYTVGEIKAMFQLSDERFERDLSYVSGEIWRISMAIGFAGGKDIFCFPWLNRRDVHRVLESDMKVLRENRKLVLIPSSQGKALKKHCDKTLYFNNYFGGVMTGNRNYVQKVLWNISTMRDSFKRKHQRE